MVHFGDFLKTWSLRSNRVTRQVSFNRSKIGWKCQNWKIQMRHFGWFSNTMGPSFWELWTVVGSSKKGKLWLPPTLAIAQNKLGLGRAMANSSSITTVWTDALFVTTPKESKNSFRLKENPCLTHFCFSSYRTIKHDEALEPQESRLRLQLRDSQCYS